MGKIITKENFINTVNKKYNFKYDYSKFIYIDMKTKSIIICPIHKEFLQTPRGHKIGGCDECGRELARIKKLLTFDKFVFKGKKRHNNKYNYDYFNFIDINTKGIIKCNDCNDKFEQSPHQHLRSTRNGGCRMCAKNKPYTTESFIDEVNKIHNNEYDYSKFKYINMHIPGIIICKKNNHGEFSQIPADHIYNEAGCPVCAGNIQLSNDIVDERLAKLGLTRTTHSDYVNLFTDIIVLCNKCNNTWNARPSNIFRRPCPFCIDKNSKRKNEKLIYNFLNKNNIDFIYQFQLSSLEKLNKKLRADFYLKNLNLIIEYNGAQHYQPVRFGNMSQEQAEINFEKQKERDNTVKKLCEKHKIKLIFIDGRKFTSFKLQEFMINELIPMLKELNA